MRSIYKYLISLAAGIAAAAAIAYAKGILDAVEISAIYHILSDSFMAPAVVIGGIGGLIFVSNEGVFDGITYGMNSFFDMFRKEKKVKGISFFDYKQAKAEENMSCGFFLLAGATLIVITVVMYLLYLQNV